MDEDDRARRNRELIELLNELRVALPGVQLLFAFLLTVPFTDRFSSVTGIQRGIFFGSFLCTTFALALLIAPSVYHRLHFRAHNKEHLLRTSNRFAIAGIALLSPAIVGVVFLITDILFEGRLTLPVTAVVAALLIGLWFALPLWRRRRQQFDPDH